MAPERIGKYDVTVAISFQGKGKPEEILQFSVISRTY